MRVRANYGGLSFIAVRFALRNVNKQDRFTMHSFICVILPTMRDKCNIFCIPFFSELRSVKRLCKIGCMSLFLTRYEHKTKSTLRPRECLYLCGSENPFERTCVHIKSANAVVVVNANYNIATNTNRTHTHTHNLYFMRDNSLHKKPWRRAPGFRAHHERCTWPDDAPVGRFARVFEIFSLKRTHALALPCPFLCANMLFAGALLACDL